MMALAVGYRAVCGTQTDAFAVSRMTAYKPLQSDEGDWGMLYCPYTMYKYVESRNLYRFVHEQWQAICVSVLQDQFNTSSSLSRKHWSCTRYEISA